MEEAETIISRENNLHYLALCRLLHGDYLWKAGDHGRAGTLLAEACAIFVKEKLREPELQCLVSLYRIRDEPLRARDYPRVRALLRTPIGFRTRVGALLLVSDYWFVRGQLKRAIDNRFEAVMILEESRASILSQDLRESFFGDKVRIYETLVAWLFQWKNPRAALLIFKILELSGSRRFSERLSEREHLPPVLNREESSLLEKQRLESRLLQLDRKRHALSKSLKRSEAEKEALLLSYREVHRDLKKLNGRMRDEERLGLYFPLDLSPEEVQKHLPEGHLVVSYFLRGNRLFRLELDRTRLRGFHLALYPEFRAELNEFIHILANRLTNKSRRMEAILARMTPLLLPRGLKRVSHLILIPHGELRRFPFAVLHWRDRPLLKTHGLSLSPNMPALYFSLQKVPARLKKPLFFFSERQEDPSAGERRVLGELFPHARIQNEFDKETLAWIAESDFIHFAGHCFFDRLSPRASYLSLAGKRLPLAEIQGLRLNQPFINLATCQSGSVSMLGGNEPYGFIIDFFAAGAVQILAGLWDLEDGATTAWMEVFYRNLRHGSAEAYRRACLAMMAIQSHPSNWSGFCLFGKP